MSCKVYVHDAPKDRVTFAHIALRTGYADAIRSVRARTHLDALGKLEIALPNIDVDRLRHDVTDALRRYGSTGWQHSSGNSLTYGGFSLTFNPDHGDGIDPRFSSLGSPRNQVDDFTNRPTGDYADGYGSMKNSYYDTYGFRLRTQAAKEGYLAEILDSIPLSLVRSRVGIIPGANVDPADAKYRSESGWHRDEPVFENLRINIPLQTDPNYVFESEGWAPYHLAIGRAYTWDTHRTHRVYCLASTRTVRIHLVLGFSPWFRYLPEDDAWEPNEFFGRLHPFDMIADGCLGPNLRLATSAGRGSDVG